MLEFRIQTFLPVDLSLCCFGGKRRESRAAAGKKISDTVKDNIFVNFVFYL